jgi:hypothetical protein
MNLSQLLRNLERDIAALPLEDEMLLSIAQLWEGYDQLEAAIERHEHRLAYTDPVNWGELKAKEEQWTTKS